MKDVDSDESLCASDALSQCWDETLSPRETTLACLPLHTNMIALHQLLGR